MWLKTRRWADTEFDKASAVECNSKRQSTVSSVTEEGMQFCQWLRVWKRRSRVDKRKNRAKNCAECQSFGNDISKLRLGRVDHIEHKTRTWIGWTTWRHQVEIGVSLNEKRVERASTRIDWLLNPRDKSKTRAGKQLDTISYGWRNHKRDRRNAAFSRLEAK